MTALTVLDYKLLEETGKDHESRLKQKELEISVLKIKETQHNEEMIEQKEQMKSMQERLLRMEDMMTVIGKSGGPSIPQAYLLSDLADLKNELKEAKKNKNKKLINELESKIEGINNQLNEMKEYDENDDSIVEDFVEIKPFSRAEMREVHPE